MPEPYLSGYYNPGTNSAAFPMSYPTAFNQPAAWSTGANTQPQSYEHAAFGYGGGLSGPSQASVESQQYVAADHLFSQSSPYQSTFAPYLNGGMGNWSYFNSANSFFFPTGTGDLNLSWGAAETLQDNNAAFLQDIYKPPEHEKGKVEGFVNEMVSGFENADVNSTESVEHGLSNLNVTDTNNTDGVVDVSYTSDNALLNSVNSSGSIKSTQMDPVSIAPGYSVNSNAPAKPVSWAAVASQPAKNKSPPRKSSPKLSSHVTASVTKTSHSAQNGAVTCPEGSKTVQSKQPQQQQPNGRSTHKQAGNLSDTVARDNDSHLDVNNLKDDSPLLKKLMAKFNFNPREFKLNLSNCRFFIIKSYSEDDIFRSIKYSSWTSTEHGNRRLNDCYKEAQRGKKGSVYLLFSVNSSGHFCGVAEMMSEVDFNVETGIWVQDKWKGRFDVRWIYVKDVPNNSLRHIRLENNENKPVTNSRDTQEVPFEKGKQIVKIIHNYKAQTSIFDDFSHYEKRQEEDAKLRSKRMPDPDL